MNATSVEGAPPPDAGAHRDATGAARWSGIIGSSYGLLQFLTAPLLGRLADRYGRRPVLLASLTCLGVDYLEHAVTPTIVLLVAFNALAGVCAGTTTVVPRTRSAPWPACCAGRSSAASPSPGSAPTSPA